MRSPARLFILSGLILAGCGTARDVAVTSFRVLDAPAAFVRRRIEPQETTTTTTTVRQTSDVSTPGQPVVTAPTPARTTTRTVPPAPRTATSQTPAPKKPVASATPRPSAAPSSAFPTAKPVPGKPGYVYSIDPKGGIVDVTGYKSGDKAKDPYTQQIFVVP